MVRVESRVVVRVAVIGRLKVAAPAPSATIPPAHLLVSLQLPFVSTIQEPFVPRAVEIRPMSKAAASTPGSSFQ